MATPPPSSGSPCRRIHRMPELPPLVRPEMFTRTRPFASCPDSWTWPENVSVNALVGSTTADVVAVPVERVATGRARSDFGVPARAAQPGRAGPLRYQPPIASGVATTATVPARRRRDDVSLV